MSIAEIKESVDAMPKDERAFLEAYLKAKNLTEESSFKKTAGDRLATMKDGNALSSSQLKELNDALSSKGL